MSIPRPLLWCFIFFILVFAYAKSFTGEAIWDDYHFIFWRFDQMIRVDHWKYWRFHIWPLFDSTSAILYQIFKGNTLPWHLLNFSLHVINGALLGALVRSFNKKWATPLMVLFWLHPLNVLSVAWIIQLKTLMCGFFILLASHAVIIWWKTKRHRWYWVSIVTFALALFAKSAALPFPWLVLGWALFRKKLNRRLCLSILPFLLLTLWSTWRIQGNQMVQQNVAKAEEIVANQTQTQPDEPMAPAITAPTISSLESDGNTAEATPAPPPEVTKVEETPPTPAPAELPVEPALIPPTRLQVVVYALGSYLAYPFFPWPLTPVHGAYQGGFDWQSAAGFTVSAILIVWGLLRKSRLPLALVAAQAGALIPFLGFIVAPYMTYTTISEQHYYLVLPFTLALQLWALFQLPEKLLKSALVVITLSFTFLTNDYSHAFQNELSFYERVRHFRPEDRLAALNLAGHFGQNSQQVVALRIIERALQQAEEKPVLKQDPLHPSLLRARDVYQLSDQ